MKQFFKKLLHNMNFYKIAFLIIIIITIIDSIITYNRHKTTEVSKNDTTVVSKEIIKFPDVVQINVIDNPMFYDCYNGIFGYHFDNKLLKLKNGEYKLLVLNENCSGYLFDQYSGLEDTYLGITGGNYNIVYTDQSTQKELQKWKDNHEYNYIETFDNNKFYFYIIKQYDYLNKSIDGIVIKPSEQIKKNPILQYFAYFGIPVQWYKAVLDVNEYNIDVNNKFWNTYNYKQKIICPYKDKTFNIDDQSTYRYLYIGNCDFYFMKNEHVNNIDEVNFILKNNNMYDFDYCVNFTKTLFQEYYIELN